MSALIFVFKSGDCLVLGATTEIAQSTYGLILSAEGEFVSLEGLGNLPKFALRRSEIAQMWLDPSDTTTIVASDALAHLQATLAIRDLGYALVQKLQGSTEAAASATPTARAPDEAT